MFNKFLNRKEGASPQKVTNFVVLPFFLTIRIFIFVSFFKKDSKKPPKSKADDTLSQGSMTSQVN